MQYFMYPDDRVPEERSRGRAKRCYLCGLPEKCRAIAIRNSDRSGEEGEFTYYVIGYGRQPGSGYKIKVKEFSSDKTHIYIDTTLTGVTKEHQRKGTSCPYIILKSQFYEKDVIFH